MAAPGSTFKQDMPPQGGYEPINWTRIPAKTYMSGWKIFGTVFAMHCVGLYGYYKTKKMLNRVALENNDAKLAIEPLLWAERDREFLKQIRRNRDDEEELMKNVPGWQTGTLYGESIYKTVDKDDWVNPTIQEYYAQAHHDHLWERFTIHLNQ